MQRCETQTRKLANNSQPLLAREARKERMELGQETATRRPTASPQQLKPKRRGLRPNPRDEMRTILEPQAPELKPGTDQASEAPTQ
jgi:hypothetical protein